MGNIEYFNEEFEPNSKIKTILLKIMFFSLLSFIWIGAKIKQL